MTFLFAEKMFCSEDIYIFVFLMNPQTSICHATIESTAQKLNF